MTDHIKNKRIRSEDGFTLLEVMVSLAVFMMGFALIIAILGNLWNNKSASEIELARNVAREIILLSEVSSDFSSSDTVVVKSNMSFKVTRIKEVDGRLTKLRVIVKRESTDKQLVDFYSEFVKTN